MSKGVNISNTNIKYAWNVN